MQLSHNVPATTDAARQRVWDLVAREKADGLSEDETSDLEHYLQLEHILRLAKARAQRYAHVAPS